MEKFPKRVFTGFLAVVVYKPHVLTAEVPKTCFTLDSRLFSSINRMEKFQNAVFTGFSAVNDYNPHGEVPKTCFPLDSRLLSSGKCPSGMLRHCRGVETASWHRAPHKALNSLQIKMLSSINRMLLPQGGGSTSRPAARRRCGRSSCGASKRTKMPARPSKKCGIG
jgi:hypothetical protein